MLNPQCRVAVDFSSVAASFSMRSKVRAKLPGLTLPIRRSLSILKAVNMSSTWPSGIFFSCLLFDEIVRESGKVIASLRRRTGSVPRCGARWRQCAARRARPRAPSDDCERNRVFDRRVASVDALKSSAWSKMESIGVRASNRICLGCVNNSTPQRS